MVNTNVLLLAAAISTGAVASLKDDALQAWVELQTRRPTHVVYSRHSEYSPDHKTDCQYEFKRRGGSMSFFERQENLIDGKAELYIDCFVVNERYYFHVSRISDGSQWMLRRFYAAGTKGYQAFAERVLRYGELCCFPGIRVANVLLPDIVKNTDCDFEPIEGDQTHCRLEFRRKGTERFRTSNGLIFAPLNGIIILDTTSWVVESVVWHTDGDPKAELTVRYCYNEKDSVVPEEWTSKRGGATEIHRVSEYSTSRTIPDRDFRLTAFGLPEPSGGSGGKRTGLWCAGIAAVILLFVGIWLVRRRQ